MSFLKNVLQKLKTVPGFIKNLFSKQKNPPVLKNVKNADSNQKKSLGKKLNSIKVKLVLAFLLTLIPIAFLGISSVNVSTEAIKELAKSSSIETIEKSSETLGVHLENIMGLSTQIFTDTRVQEYFSDTSHLSVFENLKANQEVSSFLAAFSMSNDIIQNITVIAEDKKKNISVTGSSYDVDIATLAERSEFIKNMLETTGRANWVVEHPYLESDDSTQSYSLSLIRPLKNSSFSNKSYGILILDLKKSFTSDFLTGTDLGKNSEIHIVSPDGHSISSLSFEKDRGEIDHYISEDLLGEIREILKVKDENYEELSGTFDSEYYGTEHLITFAQSEQGHIVVGLVPYESLLEPTKGIIGLTNIAIIIAVAVAFGLGLYMAMGMGRSIDKVINAAELAASGDLTVKVTTARNDEFGNLTSGISKMITSMKGLIKQASEITYSVEDSASTVSTASQQVSAVSHEITRAIQEISQGASSQATEAEQASTKMEFLADSINNISESTKSIEKHSTQSLELTKTGMSSIENLGTKNRKTNEISSLILSDINELDGHSNSIGKIIKVIRGIADQTNLLALNAAIEAARAGEMGKGFAVVADEVRKLAEQSMEATREIADIIKETQRKTQETVERAHQTEEIVKSQNEAVENTVSVFKNIAASMESLVVQVQQILKDMNEMDKNKQDAILSIQNISAVSEETAASTEEVTASTEEQLSSIEELASRSEQLREAASSLTGSINKFKLK